MEWNGNGKGIPRRRLLKTNRKTTRGESEQDIVMTQSHHLQSTSRLILVVPDRQHKSASIFTKWEPERQPKLKKPRGRTHAYLLNPESQNAQVSTPSHTFSVVVRTEVSRQSIRHRDSSSKSSAPGGPMASIVGKLSPPIMFDMKIYLRRDATRKFTLAWA
jgi:hypothetical protein